MIGRTISHFHVLEKLGGGGMGVVYLAENLKLKSKVALKFLPPHLATDDEAKQRFVQEAQAASALNHPNICTVHDIDETDDGQLFITMAHYEGETLKEKLERGALPTDEALEVARQVAEGLRAAHEQGIIHRDIKPANIFITERGRAVILDFGLAKLTGALDLTKSGSTLGTVYYMSPEQIRGEQIDHRADIWSLGVVLYEMLAGRRPFAGDYGQAVMYSILNEDPLPIGTYRDDVPDEVQTAIVRALQRNRGERIPDTQALQELLLGRQSAGAKTMTRSEHFRRPLVYAILATVAVVIGAVGVLPKVLRSSDTAIRSLAVLPLTNFTGEESQDYFVAGMHEAIIEQLSRIEALTVIARRSVLRYSDSDRSVSEIASDLDVDVLVEGSVYRSGDSIRIAVQLVDGDSQRNLWASSYQAMLRDVLTLQRTVAQSVVEEIEVSMTPAEEAYLETSRVVNPGAYEAYLRGWHHWDKLTPADLDAALGYFERSIELDPDYAPAHAGIAAVWIGLRQMGLVSSDEAGPNMKAAARRALELDSTLAEVHLMLATAEGWGEWNWDLALAGAERAVSLDPNDPTVRAFLSHWLVILGRFDDALIHGQKAVDLDPFNPLFRSFYSVVLGFAGRYAEAVVEARIALESVPNHPVAFEGLVHVLHAQGRYDEALQEHIDYFTAVGDTAAVNALTEGRRAGGYREALRALADLLKRRADSGYVSPVFIATLYEKAGDLDEAMLWIERAYVQQDANLPYVARAPEHQAIRSDPRSQDIFERMDLFER